MIREILGHVARYRSALPPEECTDRLAARVVRPEDVDFKDEATPDMLFVGHVGRHRIDIRCRHRDKKIDSEFGLDARIYRDGPSTLIRGHFQVPQKTRAYLIWWTVSMVIFAIYLQWSPILGTTERLILLAAPVGMIAFVLLTSWFQRGRLARDEAAISELLVETIEAKRYRLNRDRGKRRKHKGIRGESAKQKSH